MAGRLWSSLSGAHARQYTLGQFKWKKIETAEEVEQHLQMGTYLEGARYWFACSAALVYSLSYATLNKNTFRVFFDAEEEDYRNKRIENDRISS
jgi:hypothetical protein